MQLRTYTLAIIALAAFASCNKSGSKPNLNTGNTLTLNAVEQQKAVTDNTFTFKLFDKLAPANSSDGNLFISPLSVSIAMAMTGNGANGQTLTDIDNTMSFNGFSQSELNSYYNKLITQLPKLDPNTTLNIANSVWYRQGFDVLPGFISANSNYYKAEVSALDFSSPSAVSTINSWVNSNTNGKIPKIIDQIPTNEELYLINALYFKSTWKESFDKTETHQASFFVSPGNPVHTDFMAGNIDINTCNDINATVFEMPYSGNKYSMVIVLPKTGKTLSDILPGLDQTQWTNWMSSLKAVKTQVSIPEFAFSYGMPLKNALTSLGMGIAFSDVADFSKISTQNLSITDVEHNTYIAVDESGTEAAAATSVGVGTSAEPIDPPDYTADRPFIFAIRERNSGLVIFAGIINNPLLTTSGD